MKRWQTAAVVSVIALVTSLTGWGWWSGKGVFQNQPHKVKIYNALEGVEYMDAYVDFQGFENFNNTLTWVEGSRTYYFRIAESHEENIPKLSSREPPRINPVFWKGERIQALPRFLGNDYSIPASPRTKKQIDEVNSINRDFSNSLSEVVLAEGFRPSPRYRTPSKTHISKLSTARLFSVVKTYKQGRFVAFQIETYISRSVRAGFKEPTLLGVKIATVSSRVYVVAEKDALKAIKGMIQNDAKTAFRGARVATVDPPDIQQELPEYSEQN